MERLLLLSTISVLHGLDESELKVLDRAVVHAEASKGTTVQTAGEAEPAIVFVKKGKLRMYRQSSDGKEFTIGLLGEGNIFGDTEWFGLGTRNIGLDVVDDAIICTLSEQKFKALIEANPSLSFRFMKLLSDQLRRMEEMVTVMAIGNLRSKILLALHSLVKDFGTAESAGWYSINLRISHDDIAAMTGANRESVTRSIRKLSNDGIVLPYRTGFKLHLKRAEAELEFITQ